MTAGRCQFEVEATHGAARRARLTVRGRVVKTPAFMPVGTQATVKGIPGADVSAMGFDAALANTYHLHLRPGEDIIRELGGLHRVMDFPGLILTDSGGYQVFSLADRRQLDDDGVTFSSHIDGRQIRLTPQRAMEIQHALDSDVAMVLDECPPVDSPRPDLERAVNRSLSWAARSLEAHRAASSDRACFSILQGGQDFELRAAMASELVQLDFDGFAIGGVSVGEDAAAIREAARQCAPMLPEDRPRYLMGVGSPRELVSAVSSGVDLFDCVLPTRRARTASVYTRQGLLNLRNAKHARDTQPIEEDCPCPACRNSSRGVLRHYFQAGEILGPVLATHHNLHFFARLIADLHRWIEVPSSVDWTWLETHY